jgi:hypothetical protein
MIVSFSGKKMAGKTTASQFADEYFVAHGCHTCHLQFAEYLKNIVLKCFVPPDWKLKLEDLTKEKNKNLVCPCGKTVRELLQLVGTDLFRNIYENVWVNCFAQSIFNIQKLFPGTIIINSDCRFPNELEFLNSVNAIVIRLLRNPTKDAHVSETALDAKTQEYLTFKNAGANTFTCCIDNRNMNLKELKQNVFSILDDITGF